MASMNPFDLLDDDSEDLSQLVAAKQLKQLKLEKAATVQPANQDPASQAAREGRNGHGGGREGGRRDGGGNGRVRGGGYKRGSRNNDSPGNENGYGGGYRRSEEGDGARRGGPVGGYRGRGGRRGGFSNGDSVDVEHRPRRNNFDRHSGTGHGNEFKRDGAGRNNLGTTEDEIPSVNGETTTVVEKDLPVEKEGGEGEATDANKEKPVEVQAKKVPEIKVMTLEEYEKVLVEKKKALQANKVEERKVDTKAFDSMQQLSSKKSNNDDVFIKLGTEKDKRTVEKEEKTKKSLSINEFLKPANGARYRSSYRGGRGGQGGREPREGGAVGGNEKQEAAAAPKPKPVAPKPAPKIEDTAQFPTLGK